MTTEIKVPVLPESVADATIASWHKKVGEFVKRDEHLLDIETDKVVLEVVAPEDGILEAINKQQGEVVVAEEVVGLFKPAKTTEGVADSAKSAAAQKKEAIQTNKAVEAEKAGKGSALQAEASRQAQTAANEPAPHSVQGSSAQAAVADNFSPSMRRKLAESSQMQARAESAAVLQKPGNLPSKVPMTTIEFEVGERVEKRVPMTRLRARVAERLLQAQHNAAILTTFNEINMQPVIALRQRYRESFEKTYGVRLGFMSFFTMAVVEALKHFPIINASVDGSDIVYHGYYDIGIAVSTARGLVVPVLKNAETLSMAEIEKQIAGYSQKAQSGQLSIEDMTGGTFTITNGGVFGSLMATPILNPPQSAILGMHKIQERPIAENGQVMVRPMMYVALSYDHRIIDGADSVRFLVTVKELLEDPARLALGI